jgi:hypothetical protein
MFVKFEVLTSVTVKITIFWDVTPCNLKDHRQYFGGTSCLDLEGRRIFDCKDGGSRQHFRGAVATFFKGEIPSSLKIGAAGFPEMLETIYQTMSHPRRC